jgi:hypothetical protein
MRRKSKAVIGMKKSSIRQFTKKCLKAGYKEQVCKNAWIFGKLPTKELQDIYGKTFKAEKTYRSPHTIKQTRKLKYNKPPTKITKAMLLKASGPLIF